MASVAAAAACPTTTAYRAVGPHFYAASSSLRHAFCPPMRKARVFAPVLGSWCGLRRLRLSIVGIRPAAVEKKGKFRRMVVYASLFGVGAPEALVIGVVALLVFGPKGLAEVARTLGKTLKAFQPTIRELQEVSRDFKTTLEREIGLDEDTTSIKTTANQSSTGNPQEDVNLNGSPSFEEILRATREQLQASAATTTPAEVEPPATKAYTSEELLKVTEEQLAASATAQQSENASSGEESQAAPEIAVGTPAPQKPESKEIET